MTCNGTDEDYNFQCSCGNELGIENTIAVIAPDIIELKCPACDMIWEIKLNKNK